MIGWPDPDSLSEVISVRTLQRWQKYQEQVGYRDDVHWGMLLSLLFNVNRDEQTPPAKPMEWMPYLVEEFPDKQELAERLQETMRNRLKRIDGEQQ